MEQPKKYYFNITYFGNSAMLRCQFPTGLQYSIPQISILHKKLKKIKETILEIKSYLPQGEKIIISEKAKEGNFGMPLHKRTLSRLCNMLNNKRPDITFKLAT